MNQHLHVSDGSQLKRFEEHLETGFLIGKNSNFIPEGKIIFALLACLATSEFINMPKPVNSVKKPSQTSHTQANM